jgi:Type IV secretion-system coupling protein DNA-binding domain
MTGRFKVIMLVALVTGLLLVFLINEIGITWYPPMWTSADGRTGYYDPAGVRTCMGARALAALADRSSAWQWHRCATTLAQAHALDGFHWRYWALISASAFTLIAAFGFALAVRFDRPPHRVLRGRQLLTGDAARRAFIRSAKHEIQQSGAGLEFLPGFTISRERETRHWLIWGSVGAGKTQTMLHLILAAIERGDGVLVLDVKGDMTATLPGDPYLIAPQDQRSMVWDVARDCRTKQDARELANRLIPDSQDPMWADAARDVFVVCVASLQATKGDQWTWRDLHETGTASTETLLAMAKRYHVDAVRLLQTPDSRTTQSALSTFQTHMHVVAVLAETWTSQTSARFSISDWLQHPTPYRPVILQHDQRYPGLSNTWIGGMLALLASAVGSPSLKESRKRRIWIFADEFPQLPRLGNFSTFLDLGRSKGVIAVICAQDLAQLRATYGRDRTDAWVGMIGTKIITRINAGRGAEEASQLIGDQDIEREERSESLAGGKVSTTTSRRRDVRRVITPDEIATRLGPRGNGIRVLMLGQGHDALELSVPFVTLQKLRPGHVPAAWSRPTAVIAEALPEQARPHQPATPLSKEAADRIRELGE